jgi:hypothetical protein
MSDVIAECAHVESGVNTLLTFSLSFRRRISLEFTALNGDIGELGNGYDDKGSRHGEASLH